MSPLDQLELQKALRDNSEDTRTNFRDLNKWEQDIKNKEFKMKNSREESEDLPMITKSQATADSQTISRSEIYKIEGNKSYKAKEFEKAYRFYSKAIAVNSSESLLYTNRAMCSFNMNKYKDIIEDCNLALQLDAKWVKAYYYRMEANIALQNYKLALEDAMKLVQLAPTKIDFKEKLEYLKQKVSESEKERVQPALTRPMVNRDYTSVLDEIGTDISFINKLPHLRSKQPLKKIRTIPLHSSEAFTNPAELDTNGNAPVEQRSEVNRSEAQMTTTPTSTTLSADSAIFPPLSENTIDFDFIEKPNQLRSQKPLKRLKIVEINGNTDKTSSSKDLTPSKPSIPTSSAQFYSAWKTLGTASNRFDYLKNITAVRLNDLLGAQFDVSMLSELLDVFATYFVPNGVSALPYLQEIAKHDQMPIIQMFMSPSDRTVCQGVIDYINDCHHAEMKRLKGIFLL